MIITHVKDLPQLPYAYLNVFPNQFRTDKEKQKPSWIKETMDYFANVAYSQYIKNKKTFVKNYDLMNGIIDYSDFYQEPEIKSFVDTLMQDTELPKYVKHYPILNPPVNTMVGELSKRPDVHKVRAFDDNSKNEELAAKTEIVQQLILQMAKEQLAGQMAMQGQDPSQLEDGEFEKLALEKVGEYMTSYTSLGESWGNHMLTALKVDLNTKEQSEEAFRDLLTSARERFLIYEDNSKRGFNSKVINPKNYWDLGTPDMKYTSGASGHQNVPYANGTVEVMEMSQIIDEVQELTLEEIEHLKKSSQDYGLLNVRESNLTSGKTGPDSIIYDTYSPLILQERALIESEMKENKDELKDWLGLSNNIGVFGQKYTVVRAYWNSKKKIGLLNYLDEDNEPQKMLVDENYKEGAPNQLGPVEWGWVNQMYQGIRIGPDVFHVKPFKLLNYSPLIGMTYGLKNSVAKSLVDLMKPFQVLYNICLNQVYELFNKEIGNVASISIRRIPRLKEGDAQDEIDMFEADAKKRGIMYDDDSPENTKGGVSNQTVARNIDLTRSNEMQSRYSMAIGLKAECWELIGMNRQRLGAATATETATANQNNLVQSFAQTEPYFAAHDYVMSQYYQALLDAAQYIEGHKENSTVSYITNQGENAFLQVTGSDIKLRDLKIFVTSRAEDQQLLNEFRQLSQAMIQNGASVYDISVLYTTNSIRQMQKIFKDLKDKMDNMQGQAQQLEQQKLQQEAEIAQATLEQEQANFEAQLAMKEYEINVKANTDLAKAEIATYFQAPTTDANNNGMPDIMEIANHSQKVTESIAKRDLENKKLQLNLIKFQAEQKSKKVDQALQKEKLENEKKRTKVMASKKPTK